ncbi:hypothetical protein SteCoe_32885 [Stentor coeruleus]|uniref:Uncharacterized protein n=1 Tax=Stentor coeruleus TaxID=5963 RepID=A0A1R2AY02_9CILI|nr:hypothetical protein SteCoe_32885 [Stentor coeruleus]
MKLRSQLSKSFDELPEIILSSPSDIQNKHWKQLRNVFHASCKFRFQEAETVTDLNKLIRTVEKIPTDKAYRARQYSEQVFSPMGQALEEHRREQLFFQVIEKGDPNDIRILEKLIETDPKKYLRKVNDPNSMLNNKNREGCTPVYVACRNGCLEYVDYFIKKGADLKIKCGLEGENCIEAAARWGYGKIVKLLMKQKWSPEEVKRAKKLTKSKQIYNILEQSHHKKHCSWWGCS